MEPSVSQVSATTVVVLRKMPKALLIRNYTHIHDRSTALDLGQWRTVVPFILVKLNVDKIYSILGIKAVRQFWSRKGH